MVSKIFIGHLQGGVVALATGILGWIGLTVHETRVAVAVLTDKVERLENVGTPTRAFQPSYFDTPYEPRIPHGPSERPKALPVSLPEQRRKE